MKSQTPPGAPWRASQLLQSSLPAALCRPTEVDLVQNRTEQTCTFLSTVAAPSSSSSCPSPAPSLHFWVNSFLACQA